MPFNLPFVQHRAFNPISAERLVSTKSHRDGSVSTVLSAWCILTPVDHTSIWTGQPDLRHAQMLANQNYNYNDIIQTRNQVAEAVTLSVLTSMRM